ncbi:hypothetical protein ACKI2N_025845 [Cupriavidus sp. 30B13]|uniref:hypothetical protein n=1 Tax=Cupriavidus sp. 30B13 TaxID=3384241 RepID=UPI003B8FE9C1
MHTIELPRFWDFPWTRVDGLFRWVACGFLFLLIISISAHAATVAKCPALSSDGGVFSSEEIYTGSIVAIEKGDENYPLKLVLYRPKNGECEQKQFAKYPHEGADPIVDSLFFGVVEGHINLFVIVRWSINHRGVGTFGYFYRIYAYKPDQHNALQENKMITNNDSMAGMDGYEDGKQTSFSYKSSDSVMEYIKNIK